LEKDQVRGLHKKTYVMLKGETGEILLYPPRGGIDSEEGPEWVEEYRSQERGEGVGGDFGEILRWVQ